MKAESVHPEPATKHFATDTHKKKRNPQSVQELLATNISIQPHFSLLFPRGLVKVARYDGTSARCTWDDTFRLQVREIHDKYFFWLDLFGAIEAMFMGGRIQKSFPFRIAATTRGLRE